MVLFIIVFIEHLASMNYIVVRKKKFESYDWHDNILAK